MRLKLLFTSYEWIKCVGRRKFSLKCAKDLPSDLYCFFSVQCSIKEFFVLKFYLPLTVHKKPQILKRKCKIKKTRATSLVNNASNLNSSPSFYPSFVFKWIVNDVQETKYWSTCHYCFLKIIKYLMDCKLLRACISYFLGCIKIDTLINTRVKCCLLLFFVKETYQIFQNMQNFAILNMKKAHTI